MPNTDFIAELGALALGSRLRKLLQRLQDDGDYVHRSLGLDFKPKWFPTIYLLSTQSPLTVTAVAKRLSMTHPSTIEIIDELISAGWIRSQKSNRDGRSRELTLTQKGLKLCREMQPLWNAFRVAGEAINKDYGNDFLKAVGLVERALDRESLFDRVMAAIDIENVKDVKRAKR